MNQEEQRHYDGLWQRSGVLDYLVSVGASSVMLTAGSVVSLEEPPACPSTGVAEYFTNRRSTVNILSIAR